MLYSECHTTGINSKHSFLFFDLCVSTSGISNPSVVLPGARSPLFTCHYTPLWFYVFSIISKHPPNTLLSPGTSPWKAAVIGCCLPSNYPAVALISMSNPLIIFVNRRKIIVTFEISVSMTGSNVKPGSPIPQTIIQKHL